MLLKQEAGASGVALGKAVARVFVHLRRGMYSLHVVLILSAEISVTPVAVIFHLKYAGQHFSFCPQTRTPGHPHS